MFTFAGYARYGVVHKITSLVCLGALLAGCGSLQQDLRPAAPPLTEKTAKEVAGAERAERAKRKEVTGGAPDFDDLRGAITALRLVVIKEAEKKNAQSWNANLTTLIGGAMATIGSIASRTGLTNTGIGIGLIGLSGEQFYKPVNAIETHLDFDSKLLCLEDLTHGLREADRALAAGSTYEGSDEARTAFDQLNHSLNSAMLTYRRSLLGIRPGTPSRDELLGFINKFKADEEIVKVAGQRSTPQGDEIPKFLAAKKFIGLSTRMEACVKLGIPGSK